MGGAKYITVVNVQSAFHQFTVAAVDIETNAFVTSRGSAVSSACRSELEIHPSWFYQHMVSLALSGLGAASGFFCDMHDLVLLERMFSTLQVAGLILKLPKVQFGSKQVKNVGHVISENGIAASDDRIEAIRSYPIRKISKSCVHF